MDPDSDADLWKKQRTVYKQAQEAEDLRLWGTD